MEETFIVPIPNPLPKGWKQVPNPVMEALGGKPEECPSFVSTNGLFIAMTLVRELDGKKWLHVSISTKDRVPNYYELSDVKRLFLGDDSLALLLFVPKAEHVNIHPNCLHLWSCLDERPTPDFSHGSGSI